MKACTNYFHLLGSGHVIWLTRRYGMHIHFFHPMAERHNLLQKKQIAHFKFILCFLKCKNNNLKLLFF
jgi:hypothetical protein